MREIRRELRERMQDILRYLRMLRFAEEAGGTVSLQGRAGAMLPVDQQTIHVLKAGVFLHLYNLVESTVTAGLEFVADEIKSSGLVFADLDDRWQKAWAISFAKLDEDLTPQNRFDAALRLCRAVAQNNVVEIKPRISVGNLDDRRIEELTRQYGIAVHLRPDVLRAVKRQVLNDLGFLGLVRKRRNELAHGSLSFAESGRDYTTSDLAGWSWATYQYLKGLLASFESYVSGQGFRRSAGAS